MAIPWTPLHAALGLPKGPLTYPDIQQAVDAHLGEEAGLDWKQVLPGRGDKEETVKDVAAMANSGGGVIIYGVAEVSGNAESVTPVSMLESDHRVLRTAIAATRPMVQNVTTHALAPEESPEAGVLVVVVPASADAPHLVGVREYFGVPVRNGAETVWLDERAIERAYAERLSLRASRRDLLSSMVDDLGDRIGLPMGRSWLVGVATPLVPVRGGSGVSRELADEILTASAQRAQRLTPGLDVEDRSLRSLRRGAERLKVGRRRWVVETPSFEGPENRSETAHAEIHHDGSVGLAAVTEGFYNPVRFGRPVTALTGHHTIPDWMVEMFAVDLIALAAESLERSEVAGAVAVRIEVRRPGSLDGRNFALVGHKKILGGGGGAGIGQDHATRSIPRLHPVESEIRPADTEADLLEVARSLALEIVEQFGEESLRYLPKQT